MWIACQALRVDRRAARRAGGEEQLASLLRDVELDGEAVGRLREHAGHRHRAARGQLARALRPDDRVDLAP